MRILAPLVGLALLTGCPGPQSTLPEQLWVTINQNEGSIKLTGVEPDPF